MLAPDKAAAAGRCPWSEAGQNPILACRLLDGQNIETSRLTVHPPLRKLPLGFAPRGCYRVMVALVCPPQSEPSMPLLHQRREVAAPSRMQQSHRYNIRPGNTDHEAGLDEPRQYNTA